MSKFQAYIGLRLKTFKSNNAKCTILDVYESPGYSSWRPVLIF